MMADLTYRIEKHCGTLSTNKKLWSKELNLVSWNEREAKYDLRDWSESHDKMGKGVTLTKEELLALKEILNRMDLE